MQTLGQMSVREVLCEWGRHLAKNRLVPELPDEIREQASHDDARAMEFAIGAHPVMIGLALIGGVKNCVRVVANPADAPLLRLFVLNEKQSAERLVDFATRTHGPVVEQTVAQRMNAEKIEGMLIGVRDLENPGVWLIDGLHRGTAWARRVAAGHDLSVEIAIMETERRTLLQGAA